MVYDDYIVYQVSMSAFQSHVCTCMYAHIPEWDSSGIGYMAQSYSSFSPSGSRVDID